MTEPILAVRNVSKLFGSVIALSNVSAEVYPGEVTCLLGDNGAGKSTLIKIFAGVHQQTEGDYFFEGEKVSFSSPREALSRGIATVYQDLAMVPLMPIWRNFFLGAEPEKGWGPLKRYDIDLAKRTVREDKRFVTFRRQFLNGETGEFSDAESLKCTVSVMRELLGAERVDQLVADIQAAADDLEAALGVNEETPWP